jgi:hypothetical protein
MEPVEEEFGVVNIREDYSIIDGPNTTTTFHAGMGGRNVNPYVENDYSQIKNKDNDMVIPEVMIKVIKKSVPGISSLEIDGYRNYARISFADYNTAPNYLVLLNVRYHWNANNILSPEKLGEVINTSFSMMHPDVDFVKFEVKRMNIEKRNYHEEFLDMFMKK